MKEIWICELCDDEAVDYSDYCEYHSHSVHRP